MIHMVIGTLIEVKLSFSIRKYNTVSPSTATVTKWISDIHSIHHSMSHFSYQVAGHAVVCW